MIAAEVGVEVRNIADSANIVSKGHVLFCALASVGLASRMPVSLPQMV